MSQKEGSKKIELHGFREFNSINADKTRRSLDRKAELML